VRVMQRSGGERSEPKRRRMTRRKKLGTYPLFTTKRSKEMRTHG